MPKTFSESEKQEILIYFTAVNRLFAEVGQRVCSRKIVAEAMHAMRMLSGQETVRLSGVSSEDECLAILKALSDEKNKICILGFYCALHFQCIMPTMQPFLGSAGKRVQKRLVNTLEVSKRLNLSFLDRRNNFQYKREVPPAGESLAIRTVGEFSEGHHGFIKTITLTLKPAISEQQDLTSGQMIVSPR